NFHGYTISETSLPPAGTVLIAQRQLPVWTEPQLADSNDSTKLQNMLPARGCIRVLATRPATGQLWAEVTPTSCSGSCNRCLAITRWFRGGSLLGSRAIA